MTFAELIELKLRDKIAQRLKLKMGSSSFVEVAVAFERELEEERKKLVELLFLLLDGDVVSVEEVEQKSSSDHPPPPPGVKLDPTPEILAKAEKLQRLAMGSPSENERAAAWTAFEKLWQQYKLPSNLGMPR